MRLTVARLRRGVKADLPIEFVPQQLTSYGGLELLRRYFRLLDLHRRIPPGGRRLPHRRGLRCGPGLALDQESRDRSPLRPRGPCPCRLSYFRIRAKG
jgi:hypothetical protein